MPTLADFKREIKKKGTGEDRIPHMYLDTGGKVTVGVGNMLPDAAAAKKLGFVVRATRKRATVAEIEAEFNHMKKQAKGLYATSYKQHTKLDLADPEIDKLLDSRIAEFKKLLKGKFSRFDAFPVPAQMAILDMAFNLGVARLVAKFPQLKNAIDAQDWARAAKECHRAPPVPQARNDLVKKWFNDAAKK